MARSTLLAALVATVVLAGASSSTAQQSAPKSVSGSPVFVVSGRGWGHGVGMAQWGAYGYAQQGWSYDDILAHYYKGTTIGQASVTKVRVFLTQGQSRLTVSSPSPFSVRDGIGQLWHLAAGPQTFGPGLRIKSSDFPQRQQLPGPLTFNAGSSPLRFGDRPYRGQVQVSVANGGLRAINVVGLEAYLYGVVPSEMPYTWHPEALKAQAIAARSYALATRRTGAFDLYPDTRSQVYLGIEHEKPSTNAAVNATAGQVVLYDGEVAKTYFFSTSGGRTASAEDVWGEPVPYLVSVPDPYDSISPHHDWGPFVFTGTKLAKMLKMKGQVVDLQPELNSSGRIKVLNVIGTKGTLAVPGAVLRTKMGLRSTWFSVGVLSLAGPTQTVVFGGRAKLIGVARGLTQAVLQQRQAGTWTDVSSVKADKDGAVSVLVKPSVTTQYRLASGKVLAASVRVPVAPLTRFYPVRTQTQLRGYVRPGSLAGTTVLIQKQQGAAWPTVAQTTVAANGDFVAALQLTTGIYRARVNSGHGFVVGFSPVVQVTTP